LPHEALLPPSTWHGHAGCGAGGRTQDRFFLDQRQTYDNLGVQADLLLKFTTGSARHELRAGGDYNSTASEAEAVVDLAAPIDICSPELGQPRQGLNLAAERWRDMDS